MKIILAQSKHIDEVSEIFCLAFENSITFFTPLTYKIKNAIKDIFDLLYKVFGQGFLVVEKNNKVFGYIIIADNVKKLWLTAITSGFLKKAVVSTINGEYGLTLPTLFKILRNKLLYFKFELTTKHSAQVLSIAVHPEHQGKGLGQILLSEGIKYVESIGGKRIKLEARPENVSAVKIYEKYGFHVVGQTKDLQGKWLVMERKG